MTRVQNYMHRAPGGVSGNQELLFIFRNYQWIHRETVTTTRAIAMVATTSYMPCSKTRRTRLRQQQCTQVQSVQVLQTPVIIWSKALTNKRVL